MLSNHPLLPRDATKEEKEFLEFSIVNLYKSVKKEQDMFLIAFIHDLGYKKSMAAEILGISPTSITVRLNKIKARLEEGYAKKRLNKSV